MGGPPVNGNPAKWSDAANWVGGPANSWPSYGNDAVFGGEGGSNQPCTMDVGAGVAWQISRLIVLPNYTKTITVTGTLYVDKADIRSGEVAGGTLAIYHRGTGIVGGPQVSLVFETSTLQGCILNCPVTFDADDKRHLTVNLGVAGNATEFTKDVTLKDQSVTVNWVGGDVKIAAGTTWTNNGTLTLDNGPNNTFGNPNAGKWTLLNKGNLIEGDGILQKCDVNSKDGKVFKKVPEPGAGN